MLATLQKNILPFLTVLVFLASVVVWARVFASVGPPRLTVTFLNVGQGDAIFIEAPNGNQMLIDAGANGKVMRALGEQMSFFDRSIDVLLVTHPDADHLGGMLDVLSRYHSGVALVSGANSELALDEIFARELSARGIAKRVVESGTIIDLGGGVVFEVLAPMRTARVKTMEANTASIVGKLSYGKTAFLLTGDAPKVVERYLTFRYGTYLEATVLKAGHHGSDTSSSGIFLSAVDPEYTIISAGLPSPYGHPAPEVINRIRQGGSRVLHTVRSDGVTFQSDGKRIYLLK